MTKIPVNNSFKTCANCAYWAGERKPEPFFHRFEVDTYAKGKCCNMKGYYYLDTAMNATCNHFEAHAIVRK